MKLTALERRLQHHDEFCTVHVFSGDGHCSCGRDEAISQLRFLLWLIRLLLKIAYCN